ncbi:MAG: ATP synthase F1 subunit delta [Actinomycetota bacterium]
MNGDARSVGYAKALFEIARVEGDITRVADELFRIARTLEQQHQLHQTLTDVTVPAEAKEKMLDELLGGKASSHTLNILKFVVGQGRGRDVTQIADLLAKIAEEESNREIGVVTSAVPIPDDQKEKLAQALGKATGKTVSLKVIVDPSVIGGVHARVGDVVIDGTVRHRLEMLSEHLGVAR